MKTEKGRPDDYDRPYIMLGPDHFCWPDLEKSGNSKLAWLWLWCQAGHREGMIITSATAIGAGAWHH